MRLMYLLDRQLGVCQNVKLDWPLCNGQPNYVAAGTVISLTYRYGICKNSSFILDTHVKRVLHQSCDRLVVRFRTT